MNSTASQNNVEGVIVFSDDNSPENIIKRILDVEILPDANLFSNNIKGYPWKFETKYYSAEVNLYAIKDKTPFQQDFADSIKASIFHFDSSKVSSFASAADWLCIYDNIKPEVRLMVCKNFNEVIPAVLRKNILNWCSKNQFELVELNPVEENEEDDDLIPDPKGYARIVQALQAHTWGNLIMKSRTASRKEKLSSDNSEEKKVTENPPSALFKDNERNESKKNTKNGATSESSKNQTPEENARKVKVGSDELSLEENWLNNVVSGDDPGGESFEALFSKFASMKERAEGLTGDARKKYAEEVAIAFWKAMGGDEDEIEGLDE